MIVGIGCDICAIARMETILQKPNAPQFLQRVFAPEELAYFEMVTKADGTPDVGATCGRPHCPHEPVTKADVHGLSTFAPLSAKTVESLAANFAAKEAFLKATGMGLAGFELRDIAALRNGRGAPYYAFTGSAAEYMAQGGYTAHLSLSHEKGAQGIAMAYCILEHRSNP